MTYSTARDELAAAADRHGLAYSIDRPVDDAAAALARDVFGPELAGTIASEGHLGGLEVPWTVEELYLYRLDEIETRQAGYRTDARTGAVSPDWDPGKWAIADWAANPVSIDRDGSIWYARHGMGSWTYKQVADDLERFTRALARWVELFVGGDGDIFDEDDEIDPDKLRKIEETVLADLSPDSRAGFVAMLNG